MSEEQDDLYEKVKKRLFTTQPKKEEIYVIPDESTGLDMRDPDVQEWTEHAIRRRFGFRPKQEEESDA